MLRFFIFINRKKVTILTKRIDAVILKKTLKLIIALMLPIMGLLSGSIFALSFFSGAHSVSHASGGEQVYIGAGAQMTLSSGSQIKGSPLAVYIDGSSTSNGVLTLDGGTIEGDVYNVGEIVYKSGTITGNITLENGKRITLNSNPTCVLDITVLNPSLNDVIATIGEGVSLTLSNLNVTNLPENTRLAIEGNSVVIAPILRKVSFSVNNMGETSVQPGTFSVNGAPGTSSCVVEVPNDCTVRYDNSNASKGIYVYDFGDIKVTFKLAIENPQYSFTFLSSGVTDGAVINKDTLITILIGVGFRSYRLDFKSSSQDYGTVSKSFIDSVRYGSRVVRSGDNLIIYYTEGGLDFEETITPKKIELAGYTTTFEGWFIGNTAVSGTITVEGALEFTAKFKREPNKYSVSLNTNKGSGSTTPTAGTTSVTATYGQAMPSITVPTRSGYSFAGFYNTSATSGGTQYYTASGASARTCNFTGAITLYARWTAQKYTVTLNANGGSGGTTSVSATFDSAMPSATMPTRSGYSFEGFYDTSAASGGTRYYTSSGASAKTYVKAGTTTLYARWTANKYWAEMSFPFSLNSTSNLSRLRISATNYNCPGSWSTSSNALIYAITSSTSSTGGPLLTFNNLGLTNGVRYRISFEIAVTSIKTVTVNVEPSSTPASESFTTSYDTYRTVTLEFTYNKNVTQQALTFYASDWGAGQQIKIRNFTFAVQVTYGSKYTGLIYPEISAGQSYGWAIRRQEVTANSTVTTANDHTLMGSFKSQTFRAEMSNTHNEPAYIDNKFRREIILPLKKEKD